MHPIKRLFWELKLETLKVSGLNALLNSAIIFVLCAIILNLFGMNVMWSLIPSLLLLAFLFYRSYTQMKLQVIEEKNPRVKEMLRTAKDHQNSKSVMVQALFRDLLREARKIYSGTLIDYRQVLWKVTVLLLLSLIMSVSPVLKTSLPEISIPLSRLHGFITNAPGNEMVDDSSIFGEQTIAVLGTEEIDLLLGTGFEELDEMRDKDELNLNKNSYPVEVGAVGGEANIEKAISDQALARTYNTRLIEIS
ncbi:hypothetical protein JW868_01665 [Candidatus Woesearchaeota archaeon]|nr:hypothetical protein [Candidatus Woesearchaeota archaeon]